MIIILRRKRIAWTAIFLLSVIILKAIGGVLFFSLPIHPAIGDLNNNTIVIDAGHGGRDPGASLAGVAEKDINLDVAKKLAKYLQDRGHKVHMTRTNDTSLANWKENGSYQRASLGQRIQISKTKQPAILISIHCNSSNNHSYYGPQTFYKEGDELGERLANSIQSNLIGVRPTKRQAITGDYYLLANGVCPTVIVEIGYLSHSQDRKLLQSQEFRQKVAEAIGRGILEIGGYPE